MKPVHVSPPRLGGWTNAAGGGSGRSRLRLGLTPPRRERIAPFGNWEAGRGSGLISGRKAFQRLMKEGVELLQTIQDVFLCPEVTVA